MTGSGDLVSGPPSDKSVFLSVLFQFQPFKQVKPFSLPAIISRTDGREVDYQQELDYLVGG